MEPTTKERFRRTNERIAIYITSRVGTMNCVYAFLAFAFLPMIWPASMNTVQFISSGVLQLILLPLVMVGTKYMTAESDRQAKEMHDTVMVELNIVQDMSELLAKELKEIHHLHKDLHRAFKK